MPNFRRLEGGEDIFMCWENKRKYAYEKAIEAYWKHVDRYHTWMNYYALFNGALFVGFCTLLTATTDVQKTNDKFELTNNYEPLQIILCIVGLISAIAWRCSILGHEKWERNWMNIIAYYEQVNVYSILIVREKDINSTNKGNHRLQSGEFFKAFSTHRITEIFVDVIITGWSCCILYVIIEPFYNNNDKIVYFILISLIVLILIVGILRVRGLHKKNGLYSDVEGKYWINKDRI